MKLTHKQKEIILETVRVKGTLKSGAKTAGVSIDDLKEERRKSAIFKRHLFEALLEGKQNLAELAIEKIQEYAFNPQGKTDRNTLTAAIALANAYEPGFRGSTKVEGRIEHDVRVITAVPRPKYDIEISKADVKELDNPPKKMLQSGKEKKTKIYDNKGEYIGTKVESVEDVIEGEIVKEVE